MKTSKKILSTVMSVCVAASCVSAMSIPASADPEGSTYTITIPSALTVANSGWNSIGNISATGTLESGKKLTVSAASANSWALTSTSDSVSYTLKNASTDNAATTSWEFTTLPATQAIGINVDDYSTKPAGTYQDTVTFTAKVENAAGPLAPAFKDGAKIKFEYQWNGDNITYFEFTNNNGSYTLSSLTGLDPDYFNTTNLKVKADNPNVLILDVVSGYKDEDEFDRDEDFCSTIEFDATDNTFQFTKRGVKCELISVSVNGTDVTNKLTDVSTDKS